MKEILKAKMHVDKLMPIYKKKRISATKQDDLSALLKHIRLRKMKEIHLVKRLADSILFTEDINAKKRHQYAKTKRNTDITFNLPMIKQMIYELWKKEMIKSVRVVIRHFISTVYTQ